MQIWVWISCVLVTLLTISGRINYGLIHIIQTWEVGFTSGNYVYHSNIWTLWVAYRYLIKMFYNSSELRHRVSLNKGSLTISSLEISDSGRYKCTVTAIQSQPQSAFTELIVTGTASFGCYEFFFRYFLNVPSQLVLVLVLTLQVTFALIILTICTDWRYWQERPPPPHSEMEAAYFWEKGGKITYLNWRRKYQIFGEDHFFWFAEI